MHDRGGFQTVFLITPPLFLLLPLSCLTFVLERLSQSLFSHSTRLDWRSGMDTFRFYDPSPYNTTTSDDYIDVNIRLNIAPTLAVLGVSVAAFVIATIGACAIWELRKTQGSPRTQRTWSWTTLVANAVLMIASIAVLIWASVVQSGEGWRTYEDVGRDGQRFTRETWGCQIKKLYPDETWANTSCALSQATRYMLIPMALSAALVIVSTWILVRDRGGLKWLCGGKGRYGAFDSALEMYPPQMYPPQAYPSQVYPPQAYPPQGPSPQAYSPHMYPIKGYTATPAPAPVSVPQSQSPMQQQQQQQQQPPPQSQLPTTPQQTPPEQVSPVSRADDTAQPGAR